jgi:hypothetical protein
MLRRFYFDVLDGDGSTRDDEGLELESLDAAEYMAAQAAAEIGRDRLPKSDAREVSITVRDEHGKPVLTVTVAMNVRRLDLAPA